MTHRTVIRFFSSTLLAGLVLGCGKDTPSATYGPFLNVDPIFAGIDQGAQQQLTATFGGQPATVTWASSNTAVATVDGTGNVTAVAVGTAAATATLTSDPSQIRSASITVLAVFGIGLQNGVPVTGLGDADGVTRLYRIAVPAGKTSVSFVLAGGTGDADIYVQRATPPTSTVHVAPGCTSANPNPPSSCSSEGPDTNESVTVANPAKGTWYVLIKSFVYSGATLTATYAP
jgi:vibriolysin